MNWSKSIAMQTYEGLPQTSTRHYPTRLSSQSLFKRQVSFQSPSDSRPGSKLAISMRDSKRLAAEDKLAKNNFYLRDEKDVKARGARQSSRNFAPPPMHMMTRRQGGMKSLVMAQSSARNSYRMSGNEHYAPEMDPELKRLMDPASHDIQPFQRSSMPSMEGRATMELLQMASVANEQRNSPNLSRQEIFKVEKTKVGGGASAKNRKAKQDSQQIEDAQNPRPIRKGRPQVSENTLLRA